jgi:hypothetical protein
VIMEFSHKTHLTQSNKPHKKNRTKSGGKIEVSAFCFILGFLIFILTIMID